MKTWWKCKIRSIRQLPKWKDKTESAAFGRHNFSLQRLLEYATSAHVQEAYPLTRSSKIALQVVRTSFGFHLRECMGSCSPPLQFFYLNYINKRLWKGKGFQKRAAHPHPNLGKYPPPPSPEVDGHNLSLVTCPGWLAERNFYRTLPSSGKKPLYVNKLKWPSRIWEPMYVQSNLIHLFIKTSLCNQAGTKLGPDQLGSLDPGRINSDQPGSTRINPDRVKFEHNKRKGMLNKEKGYK